MADYAWVRRVRRPECRSSTAGESKDAICVGRRSFGMYCVHDQSRQSTIDEAHAYARKGLEAERKGSTTWRLETSLRAITH